MRIMMRSLRPSWRRVKASAVKRLSLAMRRWTKDFRRERERRKEAVLPTIVAEAAMNQLDTRQSLIMKCLLKSTTQPTHWETHTQIQQQSTDSSIQSKAGMTR